MFDLFYALMNLVLFGHVDEELIRWGWPEDVWWVQ